MGKKEHDRRPFIGLHKSVLFGSPEWIPLSLHAKVLYLLLKGKRNPKKKGEWIQLPYREVQRLRYPGLKRYRAIARAFQELESEGWIEREPGGLSGSGGTASRYRFTWKYEDFGRTEDEQ